jgi:SecD/SecF fusion protein
MLAVVIGLAAASLVAIALRPATLGLDLQGGVEVILEGRPTAEAEVNDESIDRAVEVIRSRVDAFGVAEPEIQTQNDDQIAVALPGAENPEQVVNDLIKPAQLRFYDLQANLVGPQGEANLGQVIARAQRTTPDEDSIGGRTFWVVDADGNFLAGPFADRESLQEGSPPDERPEGSDVKIVPGGLVIVSEEQGLQTREDGPTRTVWSLLQNRPGLTGQDISEANSILDTGGLGDPEPIVTMQFTDNGRQGFSDITRDLAQRGALRGQLQQFAIVLDGEIISAPTVDFEEYPTGIDGRNGAQIQGNFSQSEAQRLADQINSGAIPIDLVVVSQKQVSATLGKESLRQALVAGIVGLALVLVFLIAYYRLLGVVAAAAIVLYGIFFWAVIVAIPITLTLPGIAGIILTIGIASDANVVIFERVREEARAGRTPRAAILNGYKNGITSIIDANVVTLATAAVIFLFATSGPKGFAFTLMVGTLISFFTAVFATRAVFEVLADTKVMRNERLLGVRAKPPIWRFDFVGKWKLWLAISFIPIIVGMAWIGAFGLNLGLDFTSGTRITATFQEQPSEDALRQSLGELGLADAQIQATSEQVEGETVEGFQIQTETLSPPELVDLDRVLTRDFGEPATYQVDLVGPTFGEQVIRNAIYAVLISFLIVAIYLIVRFEYKLALPAMLSVVQDVLLSISIYAFTGREVTAATVAALLTILGYSLYDVVIVFDRIRENIPLMRNTPYRSVVNRSIEEMLTRSLITSGTTLVPVAAMFIFGGETLKDFSFALLVGIFSGGASSIFIAAPLAALWKEREPEDNKRRARSKRRTKVETDSDVVDLDVLARAEESLDADLVRAEIGAGPRGSLDDDIDREEGAEDEEQPPRRGRRSERAEEPAPEATAVAEAPEATEAPDATEAPEPAEAPELPDEVPAPVGSDEDGEQAGDEPDGRPSDESRSAEARQRAPRERRHTKVRRKRK